MLSGKIAIVTGASRGIGAGIAREFAANGARVILVARSEKDSGATVQWGGIEPTRLGGLSETLAAIESTGGKAEACPADLLDNDQIEKLVAYVADTYGRIDILANCAMGFPKSYKGEIWNTEAEDWAAQMDVGVRSKYMMARFVSPVMMQQKSGLIANISAGASKDEYYNPVFRMAMSSIDRMTSAIAHDLKPYGVSAVSIWPRWVRTERVMLAVDHPDPLFEVTADDLAFSDTPEFTGRAIAHLAADPNLGTRSGRTYPLVQLAHDYGFSDLDGTRPPIDDHTRNWMRKLSAIHDILHNDPTPD